jgi:hypothetical protein
VFFLAYFDYPQESDFCESQLMAIGEKDYLNGQERYLRRLLDDCRANRSGHDLPNRTLESACESSSISTVRFILSGTYHIYGGRVVFDLLLDSRALSLTAAIKAGDTKIIGILLEYEAKSIEQVGQDDPAVC